jgi:two-component system, oxyanion-binding sensor
MNEKLRIGFIPLVDATVLLTAVDGGFAAAEGLDIELIREVSWSNVRDKLNIGLFDAAHLLSPVAIASSLGIGHVRVPLVVPFNLGINGNAIMVSPWLFQMQRMVISLIQRLRRGHFRVLYRNGNLAALSPLTSV